MMKDINRATMEAGLHKLMGEDYSNCTIESQPKVDEWIPVSEELPEEEYDTVLVFLESNIYDIAVWSSVYGFIPWYAGYFEEVTPEWGSKVLAWMPLPEPYKEENEDAV